MIYFILKLFKKKCNLYYFVKFNRNINLDNLRFNFYFFNILNFSLNKTIYNLFYYFFCLNKKYFLKNILNNKKIIYFYFRFYTILNKNFIFKKIKIYKFFNYTYFYYVKKNIYLNSLLNNFNFCCCNLINKNKIFFLFLKFNLLNIFKYHYVAFYFILKNIFFCNYFISKFFLKTSISFINIFIRLCIFLIKYNNSFLYNNIYDCYIYNEFLKFFNHVSLSYDQNINVILNFSKYFNIINIFLNKQKPWLLIKNTITKDLSLKIITTSINLFLILLNIYKLVIPKIFYLIKKILFINFRFICFYQPILNIKIKKFYFVLKNFYYF